MMKHRLLQLLAAGLIVWTAGAQALPIVFNATLNGATEDPPNASTGSGTAIVTIDDILNTMRVQVSFAGLLFPTTVTHIHCCTATPGAGNVGVATGVPTFLDFPAGVTSGTYDHEFDTTDAATYNPAFVTANGGTTDLAFDALLAGLNAGSAYLNIHTTQFGAGEIRGFLQPAPDISVPGTLVLFGLALFGLGLRLGFGGQRRLA